MLRGPRRQIMPGGWNRAAPPEPTRNDRGDSKEATPRSQIEKRGTFPSGAIPVSQGRPSVWGSDPCFGGSRFCHSRESGNPRRRILRCPWSLDSCPFGHRSGQALRRNDSVCLGINPCFTGSGFCPGINPCFADPSVYPGRTCIRRAASCSSSGTAPPPSVADRRPSPPR